MSDQHASSTYKQTYNSAPLPPRFSASSKGGGKRKRWIVGGLAIVAVASGIGIGASGKAMAQGVTGEMVFGAPAVSTDNGGGSPGPTTVVSSDTGSLVIQFMAGLTTDVTDANNTTWAYGVTGATTTTDSGAAGSILNGSWGDANEASGTTSGWTATMTGGSPGPSASIYTAIPLTMSNGYTPTPAQVNLTMLITGESNENGRGSAVADTTLIFGAVVLGDTAPVITDHAGLTWIPVVGPLQVPGGNLTVWTAYAATDVALDFDLSQQVDAGFILNVANNV